MPSPPPTVENGDKFQHFFAYAILAFFAFRLKPGLLRVWLFAAGMGVTVELAQSLTSWRSFDVLDMVANGLGALIGLLVCRILIASGVKFL
ncbi:VanZ family protein [Chitinibacter sp. SCUT-21]|uniref:VanZ family protein n=1 Tax=Chitinibacter sp. SCUT-21 TaxID=2970891 RepID=UPI0035A67EB9